MLTVTHDSSPAFCRRRGAGMWPIWPGQLSFARRLKCLENKMFRRSTQTWRVACFQLLMSKTAIIILPFIMTYFKRVTKYSQYSTLHFTKLVPPTPLLLGSSKYQNASIAQWIQKETPILKPQHNEWLLRKSTLCLSGRFGERLEFGNVF